MTPKEVAFLLQSLDALSRVGHNLAVSLEAANSHLAVANEIIKRLRSDIQLTQVNPQA